MGTRTPPSRGSDASYRYFLGVHEYSHRDEDGLSGCMRPWKLTEFLKAGRRANQGERADIPERVFPVFRDRN